MIEIKANGLIAVCKWYVYIYKNFLIALIVITYINKYLFRHS